MWDCPLGSWVLMNGSLGSSALLVGRAECCWHWEFISFSLFIAFNKTVSFQYLFCWDNWVYVNADLRQVLKSLEERLFLLLEI